MLAASITSDASHTKRYVWAWRRAKRAQTLAEAKAVRERNAARPLPDIGVRLSAGQRSLLAVLLDQLRRAGSCVLGLHRLGELAGLCRTATKKALGILKDAGAIRIEERGVEGLQSLTNRITLAVDGEAFAAIAAWLRKWSRWLKADSNQRDRFVAPSRKNIRIYSSFLGRLRLWKDQQRPLIEPGDIVVTADWYSVGDSFHNSIAIVETDV